MPDCKNEHEVMGVQIIVKGKIPGFAARDRQLPIAMLCGSSDQRVQRKDIDRTGDHIIGFQRSIRIAIEEKRCKPREVRLCGREYAYPRQDFSFGFGAFFPCSFAR